MKNIATKTMKYIIYGFGTIQILCGILWLISRFSQLSNWQETLEYIEISQTWILDEYVGILYPLFMKPFILLEGLIGIPFFMPVYLLQLLAAAVSGWFICQSLFSFKKSQLIWASVYLLTFPMLLQGHLSIAPQSLVFSAQMALAGVLLRPLRKKQSLIIAGILTLTSGLLLPDALWISLCIWIFSVRGLNNNLSSTVDLSERMGIEKVKRVYVLYFGTVLLAIVITLGTLGMVQTQGSRGRIQKTFWAGAFQRVVTEYFSRSYAMWDESVRTTFTIEEAMECAKRSDNMMYLVGPALEAEWGKKAANESYKDMTLSCLRVRTRAVVYQIRDDALDSMLMPFSVLWQGGSGRTSQTGWNYDNYKESAKELAPFYFHFSVVGLMGMIGLGVVRGISKKYAWSRGLILLWGVGVCEVLYVVFSTGNGTNYRALMFIIGIYCLAGIQGIRGSEIT